VDRGPRTTPTDERFRSPAATAIGTEPGSCANDNTRAFRFYQRWGMDLCAFYRHGARRSREAKPALPQLGADGIPLEHELELELWCSPSGSHATVTNL
jgi:hypothetical protein